MEITDYMACRKPFRSCKIVHWYQCRWMVEEVFRVLKKECYDIESSELERG